MRGVETNLGPTRAELIRRIGLLTPTPTGPERAQLLHLGDQLLQVHADPRSALDAYIKSAACGPAAKWEFGSRLLDAINDGKIVGPDLIYVATKLAAHPQPIIVPDLLRSMALQSVRTLDTDSAGQVLAAILPQADNSVLHEISAITQTEGKTWASVKVLKYMQEQVDAGLYSPGMGFYLKLGHGLLAENEIKEAVSAYVKASEVAPDEGRLHLGSYLFGLVTAAKFPPEQLSVLASELELNDLLVPDLRSLLFARILAQPRTHENILAADQLAKQMSREQLIKIADGALGKADNQMALLCYEEAIKKDPQDVLTRLQLGITNFLANDHAKAEGHFSTLMTLQAAERERWGVDKLPVRVMHWTWIQAFGHITCIDTYIKAMKLGWLPNHQSILGFDRTKPPAGWKLLSYFSKYIDIVGAAGDPGPAIDRMIFGPEDNSLSANSKDLRRASLMNFFWALPNNKGRMRYFGNIGSDVQRAWKAEGHGPILSIEEEERKRFRTVMEQSFGLPQDAWFVVLHVRESSFKPGWETHHQYTRNASIDSYDEAIRYITSKGGWVIRAGDPSMRRIKPRDKVIDYATSALRSPELDILLCAECKFFLGTNSGFSLAPPLFGKRCVLTNWSPLANPNWYPDDIFIPKLVRERKTGRYLTLEDMYASKAGWSQFARDFATDWEKLDNSPEEIRQVVEEMMEELENGVRRSPAALQAEATYHEIVERNGGYIGSRLSDGFLARNSWLLAEAPPGRRTTPSARAIAAAGATPGTASTATNGNAARL